MKKTNEPEASKGLLTLCCKVKELLEQKEYQKVEQLIDNALGIYPHAPEPHNLFGVLLEAQGDHLSAMKHFRAAYALNPAYLPSRYNLEHFGDLHISGKCAYAELDCLKESKNDIHRILFIEL